VIKKVRLRQFEHVKMMLTGLKWREKVCTVLEQMENDNQGDDWLAKVMCTYVCMCFYK